MTNEEKRWEWEVVEEGVSGGQITVEITPESVESYADAVRNTNSRYYGANNGDIAMPTNIFSDAKLRRHSVAEAAGFTALEKCINNPRQTIKSFFILFFSLILYYSVELSLIAL